MRGGVGAASYSGDGVSCGERDGREVDRRAARHAVVGDHRAHAAASVERLAATRCRCNKRALRSRHRDGITEAVDLEGTSDTQWDGHEADDVLAARTHNTGVVVPSHRDIGGFQSLRP